MSMPSPSAGSRLPPRAVPPVLIGGLRLQQRAGQADVDGQVGGWLDAFNVGGQREWTLKVYDNKREHGLEGDVQDVFFKSMEVLPDGKLRIVDESHRSWLVDVATRTVAAEVAPNEKTGREGLLTAD